MSEERRKRQLERDGSASDGNTKKMAHLWRSRDPAGDRVHRRPLLQKSQVRQLSRNAWRPSKPRCMASTGARTASSRRKCSAKLSTTCRTRSVRSRAPQEEAPVCKIAGVKLFPAWQFGDEPPEGGRPVDGSPERQDRVQPAVTESYAPQPDSLRAHRAPVAGGCYCFGRIAPAPLCKVRDRLLRFQPEVQLRHRQS